jgi:hypothetical protein
LRRREKGVRKRRGKDERKRGKWRGRKGEQVEGKPM